MCEKKLSMDDMLSQLSNIVEENKKNSKVMADAARQCFDNAARCRQMADVFTAMGRSLSNGVELNTKEEKLLITQREIDELVKRGIEEKLAAAKASREKRIAGQKRGWEKRRAKAAENGIIN